MSSPRAPGYAKQLWLRWKALKLPWRKQFLVGADLSGNTFWEFKDALNSNRLRRIVKYSRTPHYADVKLSPQWHQWLRHTRDEAPSIQEQQYDVSRQAMMKQLAYEADERWKSKPSFLDAPKQQQSEAATAVHDPLVEPQVKAQVDAGEAGGVQSAVGDQQEVATASEGKTQEQRKPAVKKREREENPWAAADRSGPGEKWQPAAWTPGAAQRR